jgi:orotate phosphoribosyltransferase
MTRNILKVEEKFGKAQGVAANDFRREFIRFCIECGVLRFGSFVTKSGRTTPYFFNAGLFNTGRRLDRLAEFYARAIIASGIEYDMVFGPAYKGIVLAAATAVALGRDLGGLPGRDVPYAFNRKEAKDHGEGGNIIGSPLAGRVLIIDDVMTAGTAVRESLEFIRTAGATPVGVVISMDRMERGTTPLSAVQEVQRQFGIPVVAIATLDDLLGYLKGEPQLEENWRAVTEYRRHYGASIHA